MSVSDEILFTHAVDIHILLDPNSIASWTVVVFPLSEY